ncbi:addiction module toxin RelE [Atopobacter sp. AH10]|nr:addiction module toxin RelE [Atopobacter sp. AH10]RLK63919.1 addiction module toxin RelE [Atopobacter sp. AH10]
MIDCYQLRYSVDAFGDLGEIYSYTANELFVSEVAADHFGSL